MMEPKFQHGEMQTGNHKCRGGGQSLPSDYRHAEKEPRVLGGRRWIPWPRKAGNFQSTFC